MIDLEKGQYPYNINDPDLMELIRKDSESRIVERLNESNAKLISAKSEGRAKVILAVTLPITLGLISFLLNEPNIGALAGGGFLAVFGTTWKKLFFRLLNLFGFKLKD